jgi:hypothetical protein
MGYFTGYYFKDGTLTKCHFTLATGFHYTAIRSQYRQKFKKSPPHWLINHTMVDRVSLLCKAVKNLEPLPEKNPIGTIESKPVKACFREGDRDDVWESALADGLRDIVEQRRAQKLN